MHICYIGAWDSGMEGGQWREKCGERAEKEVWTKSMEGPTYPSSTIICLQIYNFQEVLEASSLIKTRKRLNPMKT